MCIFILAEKAFVIACYCTFEHLLVICRRELFDFDRGFVSEYPNVGAHIGLILCIHDLVREHVVESSIVVVDNTTLGPEFHWVAVAEERQFLFGIERVLEFNDVALATVVLVARGP